ncbi:HNH endonuclease [Bacteroidales bacterium Barb6]|nr:HNH endonuclease [Bacteroidales bacterium Barb6]
MPTINKPKRKKPKTNNQYDSERRRIYNSERWRSLRLRKFAANPLCEVCEEKGLTVPAEDIHHIKSFMGTDDRVTRNQLAYDMENLMSLCKRCHQIEHNKL